MVVLSVVVVQQKKSESIFRLDHSDLHNDKGDTATTCRKINKFLNNENLEKINENKLDSLATCLGSSFPER